MHRTQNSLESASTMAFECWKKKKKYKAYAWCFNTIEVHKLYGMRTLWCGRVRAKESGERTKEGSLANCDG